MDEEKARAQGRVMGEAVAAASEPLRQIMSRLVADGISHPGFLAAAAMMVAGEIAEQMNVPAKAAERAAIEWHRAGRTLMAQQQAREAAGATGGKLNG